MLRRAAGGFDWNQATTRMIARLGKFTNHFLRAVDLPQVARLPGLENSMGQNTSL